MMKTPHREQALKGLFSLIEQYETPTAQDTSTEEGRAWCQAWGRDLNALAATCQKDPLMLYLLAAYTDYMCDAGKALAQTGHGLVWNGDTTEVLIRLQDNRVPLTEICQGIADAPKTAPADRDAQGKGGWIA